MNWIFFIIGATLAAAITAGIVLMMQRRMADTRAKLIISEAQREAETLKNKKELEGREEALRITSEAEKAANQKMSRIQSTEAKLKQRELQLNQQQSENHRAKNELEATARNLDARSNQLDSRQAQLDEMHRQAIQELEHISGLSSDEAHQSLAGFVG